ncbi:MAG: serine/threonine-protein kinase, partial [bacterium]
MTINQLEHLKKLFSEAIELGDEERKRFMSSLDAALAAELSSLLEAHNKSSEFLTPLYSNSSTTPTDERVGSLIGPYRMVREIAQGGMGEVFEAVRGDGVFDRKVAIKLVRYGGSRQELLRRFNLERQTLAKLEHPCIARLLDGGTTTDGIPYLVMEFVDGVRIDTYCDDHRLSVRERLELFLQVCSAVQYAHRNLVVHRDIKPGNILVAKDGTPKLLDFGIAKLLAVVDSLEGETTKTGLNPFTPEYASPEQVGRGNVTTVSDIYSLGALLYKLLTGYLPHTFRSDLPHEISKSVL